jgi:hypothetical protein
MATVLGLPCAYTMPVLQKQSSQRLREPALRVRLTQHQHGNGN